jgi:hypothetical protein
MKGLVVVGLGALLISTSAISAQPSFAATSQILSNVISSPRITDSGVLGHNFFLQLQTGSLPLQNLSIELPRQQMGSIDSLRITDESGRELQTEVKTEGNQALISFAEKVQPNSNLRVRWNGVNQQLFKGNTLHYSVSAGQTGLSQPIAIGSARIQIPFD